ncbi:MAG TPA: ThuA domain-containing protein [Rhizomicrobium sp.]|nr:ThuA domain-containing protein [Rhizomicrobium sp.]
MRKRLASAAACLMLFLAPLLAPAARAQEAAQQPRVLVFFSLNVENDHMLYATDALRFLAQQGDRHGFRVEATTDWNDLNDQKLEQVQMVVWLNGAPGTDAQRAAFEKFMERGGAWLGSHVAAYTDRNFKWTWFRNFIGAGVFGVNNWPPLPAKLIVDDTTSPITKGLPPTFIAPTGEWYSWRPSPRPAPNIHVLLTMDPSNYPLGIKSMITDKDGDVPVVWTNTKYRMIYMNMGHGDKVFSSPLQNRLIENEVLWLLHKN